MKYILILISTMAYASNPKPKIPPLKLALIKTSVHIRTPKKREFKTKPITPPIKSKKEEE